MSMSTTLPPGFQFFPSDEDLVIHFLHPKASSSSSMPLLSNQPDIIPSLDLSLCDPWDLGGKALQGGNQWYFFGLATNKRASPNGYWLPVGDDEVVASGDNDLGIKKTLVFYIGRGANLEGIKTNWVMHEYHLLGGCASESSSGKPPKKRGPRRIESEKWVIHRVYDASCESEVDFFNDGVELSCMDEAFLLLDDDLDEISMPNI